MSSVWNKLDTGLSRIYSNYLRVREEGPEQVSRVDPVVAGGARLTAQLQYTDDLDGIRSLGFHTNLEEGPGRATGSLHLDDLEAIAAHPGVVRLSTGYEPSLRLDVSIPDIRANQVWTLNKSTGAFGGGTGAGVIIGVIDTGIDFRHPHFRRQDNPAKSRILRIWDMGLVPVGSEKSPKVAHIHGGAGGTYGVEYTDADIDAVLQSPRGAVPVRHRDCSGHGTHVAAIAAGDGRPDYTFVGVAPKAELIIVKMLFLQAEPFAGTDFVTSDQRFKDAVSYIRKVAKAEYPGRPVVINFSAGYDMGPHDGHSEQEDWLGKEFAAATGEVFVTAGGNSAGSRQHTLLGLAANTPLEVPFELYEAKKRQKTDFNRCDWKPVTRPVSIHVYYPSTGQPITASLKIEGDPADFVAGPAHGTAEVHKIFRRHGYAMRHSDENFTPPGPGATTVSRRVFEVDVEPFGDRLLTGTFTLKLSCPVAVTAHVWCDQARGFGFRVKAPFPVSDNFTIGSNGGARNIVTVAAYDPDPAAGGATAGFSSRGPLANYGSPAGPAKPDLGAPGVKVDAAYSRDSRPVVPGATVPKGGTSMASPHVAGAVALLLQKKKDLTAAQVIALLKNNARTVPAVVADELGAGRLDAKAALDQVP